MTRSTSPARRKAAASVGPPSRSTFWTSSSASAAEGLGRGFGREDPQGGEPVTQGSIGGDLTATHHDAHRLSLRRDAVGIADRQGRVVGQRGPGADEDRIDLGAQLMDLRARLLPGDPPARAVRGRHMAVEGAGDLPRDHRATVLDGEGPRLVDRRRLVREDAADHVDARGGQAVGSAGGDRVGVRLGQHDASDPGGEQRVHTRPSPTRVVARLEGDHGGGAPGCGPGRGQRCGLRVRGAGTLMEAFGDRGPGRVEQDAAHARVGSPGDARGDCDGQGATHRGQLGGRGVTRAGLAHSGETAAAAARSAVQAAAGSWAP